MWRKIAELFPGVVTRERLILTYCATCWVTRYTATKPMSLHGWESAQLLPKPDGQFAKPSALAWEESKDWGTTENIYIEGDNLDVLKLLQESYLEGENDISIRRIIRGMILFTVTILRKAARTTMKKLALTMKTASAFLII